MNENVVAASNPEGSERTPMPKVELMKGQRRDFRPSTFGRGYLVLYFLEYHMTIGKITVPVFPLVLYVLALVVWYGMVSLFMMVTFGYASEFIGTMLHIGGISLILVSIFYDRKNRNRILYWLGIIQPYKGNGRVRQPLMRRFWRYAWYGVISVSVTTLLCWPITTDPDWYRDVLWFIVLLFCMTINVFLIDQFWLMRKTRLSLVFGILAGMIFLSVLIPFIISLADLWIG